jgi:hypothetical protein
MSEMMSEVVLRLDTAETSSAAGRTAQTFKKKDLQARPSEALGL